MHLESTPGPHDVVADIERIARTWEVLSKLKRFLSRFERNEADVEDIIQDAMLEALRCQANFQSKSSVQTWFFAVAANVARHHVSRSVIRSGRTTSLDLLHESVGEDGIEWGAMWAADSPEPMRAAELSERTRRIEHAVERLPVELRSTIELACVEERPYQEVAATLGIPIGTVRSRISRARGLLRRTMLE